MTDRPASWQRCLLAVMLLVPVACSPRLPAEQTLRSDDWGDYRVQPPVAPVTRLAFVGRRFGLSTLAPPLLVGACNGAALDHRRRHSCALPAASRRFTRSPIPAGQLNHLQRALRGGETPPQN